MSEFFVDIERLVVEAPPGATLDPVRLAALTEEALRRQLEPGGPGATQDSAAPDVRDAAQLEEATARQLARAVSDALGRGRS